MLIWYIFFLYAYLKFLLSSLSVVYIIISLFFNLHNTLPSLIVSCSLNISFVFNLNPTIWVFFSLSLCVYVCLSVCLSFTYFILSFSLLLRSGTTFFNLSTVSTRLWISICVCLSVMCLSAHPWLPIFSLSFRLPPLLHTPHTLTPSLSLFPISFSFVSLSPIYSSSLFPLSPLISPLLSPFILSLSPSHPLISLPLSPPLCLSFPSFSLRPSLSVTLFLSLHLPSVLLVKGNPSQDVQSY